MIEELVPPSVVAVDTEADVLEAQLFPEEAAALGRAVEKRRRDFVTGRACARMALARLGIEPGPIASGPRGEPLWPAGVVGSITHCPALRGCAVARASDVRSLGIDAEVHEPLPGGVLESVASATERARLAAAAGDEPGISFDRVLFSAKEAVYKAWYPLARRWLGFEDVDLTLAPRERTFAARLLVPGPEVGGRPLTELRGRWRVDGGVVATAVVVDG